MKKQKQTRISSIPPLPAWARRGIVKLAREAGMTVERISDIVLKLGLEATRNELEETIHLIAQIDKGPDENEPVVQRENEVVPTEIEPGTPELAPEDFDGYAIPEGEGVETGPDDAGERRDESGEGRENDFVDALAIRPEPGGVAE